jgi:hypothetical protein
MDMQPQQTDVLEFDGPAAAPSIIEGAAAPTSPVIYAEELFGDAPTATGPVAIVEPAAASDGTAPEAAAAGDVPTDATTSADAVREAMPPVEPTVDTADASAPAAVEGTASEATSVAAPEPESAPADADADAASVDADEFAPVERVKPEPELAFTLEQLEAATVHSADTDTGDDVELAAPTDDTDAEIPAENLPADAAAPAATVALTEPETAPEAANPIEPEKPVESSAPTAAKTATYEDVLNSEQEFIGAIKTKKFPLIDPDQFWVMVAAVIALGTILAANLTASFTSVYAMAEYTGAPKSVQWVPVVALDFAIVGFSWALMVFGARGDKVWSTRLYLFVVTGFSVVANFMHTYTHWKGDLSSPEAVFGVVFSSAVPLFSLVATEELIRLVFIRRNRRKNKKAVA